MENANTFWAGEGCGDPMKLMVRQYSIQEGFLEAEGFQEPSNDTKRQYW